MSLWDLLPGIDDQQLVAAVDAPSEVLLQGAKTKLFPCAYVHLT